MSMLLGKRLGAVASQVRGNTLADIGCDHGKLSVACLLQGSVKRVIACDISPKSLQKAADLAAKLNVSGMDFRVGDGLQVVKDFEADCVVIAGMGGIEIMNILSHAPKGIKRLVLSPQRNVVELREFLSRKNIYIDKDFIVEEGGKFYDVIVADVDSGRDCSLAQRQLLIGKNSVGEDFDKYLSHIRQKYEVLAKKSASSKQAAFYKSILDVIEKDSAMPKVKDVIDVLQQKAPIESALDFDSVGLNVGDENCAVTGILLAQNVTYGTLDECREKSLNLLITHHPCVFGEQPDEYMQSLVAKAAEYGINLYSCHTNLDCCCGGLCDSVGKMLGMKEVFAIDGCARQGEIAPVKLRDFAQSVANILKDDCVKYVGDDGRIIKRVVLCTGAGARDENLAIYAKNNKVDCIVGGESKLSIALMAKDLNVALVDVGHYTSEILCTDIFADWLKEFSSLIHISNCDVNPYKSIK